MFVNVYDQYNSPDKNMRWLPHVEIEIHLHGRAVENLWKHQSAALNRSRLEVGRGALPRAACWSSLHGQYHGHVAVCMEVRNVQSVGSAGLAPPKTAHQALFPKLKEDRCSRKHCDQC